MDESWREVLWTVFGYVMPVKGEMKVRDFDTYRGHYCGLCKQLGRSHGQFSRLFLNYDLVLLAVLADALSGQQGEVKCEGCIINPVAKRCTRYDTDGLALAADALVMLTFHKLSDNVFDEHFPKNIVYNIMRAGIQRKHKRASANRPDIAWVIREQMDEQRRLEAAGCDCLDEACEPTAKMCEALFTAAGRDEEERRVLGRLGLFCGQVVYLLDAAEDFEDDAKKKRYNVLLQQKLDKAEAVEIVRRRCRMAAGEIALCYNLLSLTQYKDILDNIFFLGLPAGIAAAGQKRDKRSNGHGQIAGV